MPWKLRFEMYNKNKIEIEMMHYDLVLKYDYIVVSILDEINFKIDSKYILAIILTESLGIKYAIRHEPNWSYFFEETIMERFAKETGSSLDTEYYGQSTSWGLMQIMGGTARELGFKGFFPLLCEPEIGIKYGILYLHKKYKAYGNVTTAIAAYNFGVVQRITDKTFINQKYVNKVLKNYDILKGI